MGLRARPANKEEGHPNQSCTSISKEGVPSFILLVDPPVRGQRLKPVSGWRAALPFQCRLPGAGLRTQHRQPVRGGGERGGKGGGARASEMGGDRVQHLGMRGGRGGRPGSGRLTCPGSGRLTCCLSACSRSAAISRCSARRVAAEYLRTRSPAASLEAHREDTVSKQAWPQPLRAGRLHTGLPSEKGKGGTS